MIINGVYIGQKCIKINQGYLKMKNRVKNVIYSVCFLSVIGSSFSIAAESNEEVLLVKNNYKKLALKKGEEIRKWDIFKSQAIKGNPSALESIFEARKLFMEGYYLSIYKYDLFEVFSKNPTFFLETSKKYFSDNGSCSAFWLLPATGENELQDVKRVIGSNPSKELGEFEVVVSNYSKLSQDEKRLKSEKCFSAK